MGISFSSTFEQLVRNIEDNNIDGLKKILNTLTKEEIKQYCADSCPEDELNRSLLHHAVWKDDNTILQILMPYCEGESLEIYDAYGMTPLGASVSRGNFSAVKTLLEHSSNISCDSSGGYYLLRNALYNNKADIADLLLQYNCVAKNPPIDEANGSLLHVACDIGNEELVKSLVEKGKLDVNIEDKWKIKATHVASAKNHINTLKYLHENGADINCEDVFGNTPLGWAIFCKSSDCELFLKSLNAVHKDFVVPPPQNDFENEIQQEEIDVHKTIEQLEIDMSNNKQRKSSIPVRKGQQSILKLDGSTNPTFDLNDERKAVTSV